MRTSNKFTLSRMILAPIIFIIYFIPFIFKTPDGSLVSIISFALTIPLLIFAELTDYWDGHYARKNGEVSDFGKMFDPFADVFLHLSMFTAFVFSELIHPVFYVFILYREFAQNFLRMVAASNGTVIAARKGGKLKTVFYVITCFVCLVCNGMDRTGLTALLGWDSSYYWYVTNGFFVVSIILSYSSFIDYLKNFGHILKKDL